jgi:hypothetical protein
MAEPTPFERVILGTLTLHELAQAGLNDSPAADAIRDGMDRPFFEMTGPERVTARKVSAALQKYEWQEIEYPPYAADTYLVLVDGVAREAKYVYGEFSDSTGVLKPTHWTCVPTKPTNKATTCQPGPTAS